LSLAVALVLGFTFLSVPPAGATSYDITITSNPTSGGEWSGGVFTPTSSSANVDASDIDSLLNSGTNVTVTVGPFNTGTIEVEAPISGSSDAGLTLSAPGGIAIATSVIATSASQTYDGPVSLLENTALVSLGGSVQFNGTVDGAENLTLNGNAVFNGQVGSIAALINLVVTGTATINTTSVTTIASQTYDGPVILFQTTALSGSSVRFNSTVDGAENGAENLTLNGNALFNGQIGSNIVLSSLGVTGTATINTTSVNTVLTQTYDGPVSLLAATTNLSATSVTFGDTLDGSADLTITGAAVFDGAVGASQLLNGLVVTGNTGATDAVNFAPSSSFSVGLGGTGAGNYTQLEAGNAGGVVSLAGTTLNVSFVDSFTSSAGNSFDILVNNTGSALSGTFDMPAGVPLTNGSTFNVGTRTFSITYNGGTSGQDIILTDVTPGTQLQITTTSLPEGTVGQPYSFALQATGGNPPYTWWYAKGGNLPRGIKFSTAGVLSGTPKKAGNYSITFRVRDTAIAGHHVNKAHAALTVTITIT
jgi:hypothetical protein